MFFVFQNALEDWFSKTTVPPNILPRRLTHPRRRITEPTDLALNGFLHLRCDNFRAAYQHADEFRRLGVNPDGKHSVRQWTRQNVEDPQAFLKPIIAPGLDHRCSLFLVEARTNEHLLQIVKQRIYILIQRRPLDTDLAREALNQPVTKLTAPILEDDQMRDLVLPQILQ